MAGGRNYFPRKLFNHRQSSDIEYNGMKTLLKRSVQQRMAWFLAGILLAVLCRPVSAQSIMVSNYSSFKRVLTNTAAIQNNWLVFTNFASNSTINLTASNQAFQIKTNVFIDGGSNDVVFDGNGLARIFTVASHCQLILKNVQLINGSSTAGGAIYNNGALIITHCILAGNSVTNVIGANGATNTSGGNGGNGGNGGAAQGGAIYSLGPVSIYYSVLGTNSALGGGGGNGGNGGNSLIFAGNGGNGGAGGAAAGAAVYSAGINTFVSTEFFNNTCAAGAGGGGGSSGSGAWPSYNGGTGADGGSAGGGAVYVAGPLFVTNCVFANNTVTSGASGAGLSENSNGSNGGTAEGGGLFINSKVAIADVENSVFFDNSCAGGAGAAAAAGSVSGISSGNGGSAFGGGLFSGAVLTTMGNCTLATNLLAAGAPGSGTNGTGATNSGSYGSTGGWDIYRNGGVVRLSASILSGGTNSSNTRPNAYGVTDAGWNISSDASLTRASTNTLVNNTNVLLDTLVSGYGSVSVGPINVAGPPFMTMDVADGSSAVGFVSGVPGLTFPATDELGDPRGSHTSAGAFEINPIMIDTNASPTSFTIASQPTNQLTGKGNKVTFTFRVSFQDAYTNALGFQWQHNGTNLSDNAAFNGSTTSNLTVKNVTSADAGSYQVIASPSLLETFTNSSVVLLVITNPAKITTLPASKSNVPNGAVVIFKVGVAGSPPPSFQWYFGANMLSDTNEISGSTTSNLTINPATAIDDGGYFVVVSNAYGMDSNKSPAVLTVVPDKSKPTVAFSSPAAGARTSHAVTGTASDNAQVTNVYYWVTNFNAGNITTNHGSATLGAVGTTARGTTNAWWIDNALFLPGTNYVKVQSVDYSGNPSSFATREFFNLVTNPFALYTTGPGTVTGGVPFAGDVRPANGAMLNIGESYTLTAHPAYNYWSNWTSSTFTNNSLTLHFIMESNLAITANFGTNPFNAAAGMYNGLFYGSNVTEQTAGMLRNLKIGSNRTYSAALLLNGASYGVSGSFNTSGYASTNVSRAAVNIQMTLHWYDGEVTGSVSGANWNSPLDAWKSAVSTNSGEYTVLLDPGAGTNAIGEIPPGIGYMLITNHKGSVALSGALADGVAFNQNVPLGVSNDVPVYASLYNHAGLLLGWLGLSNRAVLPETPMAWLKPPSSSGLFTNAFTNLLSADGSLWTNPPARKSPFGGALAITNTNLNLNFTVSITNNTLKKISGSSNSLTGVFHPTTGLLQIIFGNGSGKSTTTGYAAILQDSTNGGGFFATRTNAGAILLTP